MYTVYDEQRVDQFIGTKEQGGQLVAVFRLPAAMLAHCPDHSNVTYSLNRKELDTKITDTAMGGLRPSRKEAQLAQLNLAMKRLG